MQRIATSPAISIIVPCYNEENTIGLLLNAIHDQTYEIHQIEVIIADGLSTDRTREMVCAYQNAHPELKLRLVDNPKRIIPAALNIAIRHSQGDILIRLDAHCIPHKDYVERCVNALQTGKGENVGGVWEIKALSKQGTKPSAMARSIAMAAAHPLGVGDALYRYATKPQAVDTVPFGAFKRTLVEKIGGFDETLLTNEDYEFNVRVIQSGGIVWLDPQIRSVYFARGDLIALAKQYWRYGYWKAQMLRRYLKTLKWRQALPPVFVASLIIFTILGLGMPAARWVLLAQISLYLFILILAAFPLAIRKKDGFILLGLPLAILSMHLSWGSGLLAGLIASVRIQNNRDN